FRKSRAENAVQPGVEQTRVPWTERASRILTGRNRVNRCPQPCQPNNLASEAEPRSFAAAGRVVDTHHTGIRKRPRRDLGGDSCQRTAEGRRAHLILDDA